MIFVFIAELCLGIVGFVYQSNLVSLLEFVNKIVVNVYMYVYQRNHVESSVFSAINGYQQENTTSSNINKDNEIIDIFQEGVSPTIQSHSIT